MDPIDDLMNCLRPRNFAYKTELLAKLGAGSLSIRGELRLLDPAAMNKIKSIWEARQSRLAPDNSPHAMELANAIDKLSDVVGRWAGDSFRMIDLEEKRDQLVDLPYHYLIWESDAHVDAIACLRVVDRHLVSSEEWRDLWGNN